jgi:hypothetical protein
MLVSFMPPDAASAQYEIQKFFITAVFGFALGIAGNVITFFFLNRDRYIRILDRETKRLSFWKAMRELKTDSSEETGLSQGQINALNQRFREDVQKSVDVMMGWEKDAHVMASFAAWMAITLLIGIAGNALLPLFNLAQRSGMTPGTAEYFGTDAGIMLGIWLALRGLVYRPTYEAVQRKAVRLMREYPGKFNIFMLFYK